MVTAKLSTRAAPAAADVQPWDRRRLLVTLAAAVVVALLVVSGLGLAVYYGVTADPAATSATGSGGGARVDPDATGRQRRDQIAAAPMLEVPDEAAHGGTPAATPPPTITVPVATGTGPAGVPTGFGQTPEGAVGQLAAIVTDVMESMSIPHTNEVYHAWVMPGGAGVRDWPLTRNVQAFLGSAGGQGQTKGPTVDVTTRPVAAQVKGTDGPGWVVACVLLDVRAVIQTEARMAYGYCERMQWSASEQRWMIAPGASPAPAPSTWPGTALAAMAGWRAWNPGPRPAAGEKG